MRFEDWQPPIIEDGKPTKWNWIVQHPENFILGKKTDIGSFSYINAESGVTIEDEVQIGSHTSIYSISTIDDKQGKVLIKKNARIGSHCTVMPNLTIGENSIIGAHSFVNKDIPDNVIAYGVPVKIIRKREPDGELTKKNEMKISETATEKKETGKNAPPSPAWKILLFKTYSDEADIEAIAKVLRRGTYWTTGPEIEEFEKKIAGMVNTEFALAFNSGTSALHSLLLAHDIKGKEVIIPSFTFIATANAVVLAGGIPVFAESEADTFGLDAEEVKRKITKNTKAIISLHYGGFPSRDTEKLRQIANQHKIILIEDAAESLGSKINGKPIGSFGHSTMFSFCQNKVLATGEGGMIVTNSQEIYEKAKLIRSHGRVEEAQDYFSHTGDNDYIQAGYNYRMPTIIAALGLSQLEKMPKIIELRRSHAHYLNQRLSKIKEIRIPLELPGHHSVYQMYTIKLESKELRDQLQKYLADKKIMSKVYFNPVHLKTIYRKGYGYKEGDLPQTEALSNKVLNLPLYPSMSAEELDYLTQSIEEFFKTNGIIAFKEGNFKEEKTWPKD